jgi:hypothetical protein
MRDLAVDVVGDVGLRDTVRAGGSDPRHSRSKVTKEVTVISRQSATGESELSRTIMREEGVGMLQESDQHEPVVNPGRTLVCNLEKGWVDVTYQR